MLAGVEDGTPVWPTQWVVEHVAETGSTNADLLAAARDGAPAGTVRHTDHQTAGRGRLGRTWEAPPGASLLCSILLRPPSGAPVHRCTQAVAVAAARACERELGFTPVLKWPNDLVVGDRKLAGVLAEALVEGGSVTAVVVGIGMNLRWPRPMPGELAATATSANHHTTVPVERDRVLAALLEELAALLPGDVRTAYRARLGTLGQEVTVQLPGGEVLEGRAVDVGEAGDLLVAPHDGGPVRSVQAGDVQRLRPRSEGRPS